MTATSPATRSEPPVKRPIPIPTLNALIYGLSGAGKTRLALSATDVEALCPVLVFDVEHGLIGIDPNERWTAVPVRGLVDVENGLQQAGRYKTIVIDSISRLNRLAVQGFASARTGGRPNEDVQISDYGRVLTRFTALLDALQHSPQNVVLIAGQKFTYAENSTKQNPVYREILPDLDGGVLTRAQETADFVWSLMEDGNHQYLLTRPRPTYRIKSRRLIGGEAIDAKGVMMDPTMAKVYSAFRASFNK